MRFGAASPNERPTDWCPRCSALSCLQLSRDVAAKEEQMLANGRRWSGCCLQVYAIHGSGQAARCSSFSNGGEESVRRQRPRGYWEAEEKRREFIKEVEQFYGVSRLEEWQDVTTKDVVEMGGGSLLTRYGGSLHDLLCDIYGNEKDAISKLVGKGRREKADRTSGYWEERKRRRDFVASVGEKHQCSLDEPEEWKKLTRKDFLAVRGGRSLLRRFGGSVSALLADSLPDADFSEHNCRKIVSHGYWDRVENRRMILERVAAKNGVESPEDWRRVTLKQIQAEGGGSLITRYGGCVTSLLQDTLEDAPDDIGDKQRQRQWTREERQKFLSDLADKMGVTDKSDWAAVTPQQVRDNGGSGVLALYKGSVWMMLRDVYGDWRADECRARVPSRAWQSEEDLKGFLETCRKQLNVTGVEDWLRLSREQLLTVHGARSLLSQLSLLDALKIAYPEEKWPEETSRFGKKASQRHLAHSVGALF